MAIVHRTVGLCHEYREWYDVRNQTTVSNMLLIVTCTSRLLILVWWLICRDGCTQQIEIALNFLRAAIDRPPFTTALAASSSSAVSASSISPHKRSVDAMAATQGSAKRSKTVSQSAAPQK